MITRLSICLVGHVHGCHSPVLELLSSPLKLMVPVSHLCRVRVAKQDIELGIGRGHHTNARSEVTKHVVGHFLQDVGIQVLYAGGGQEDKGG